MARGPAAAVIVAARRGKAAGVSFPAAWERGGGGGGALSLGAGASVLSAAAAAPASSLSRRCLGDWKRRAASCLAPPRAGVATAPPRAPHALPRDAGGSLAARGSFLCRVRVEGAGLPGTGAAGSRFLRLNARRCRAVEEPDININASPSKFEKSKSISSLSGNRKLYFDTHAFVCLLERSGFTTQQSEIIVSALINILNSNMNVIYKDMVTKVQQEIALQQIMSHISVVKKDMIILEKSEFSALRAENEKIKLELQQLKKQATDEISKVRTDSKLDFNIEKSRVKELYSLNERKLLKMRTEIVELHAQQDRALTQTDKKIDTEVAGLKTMLESHKLDNIKYLAGSVFTCLTVALGFYRLWM